MKKDKIQSMYKACSAEITSRTNEIQHLLLGEGDFDANVMIVAEVPSSKEEEYGQNLLEDQRDQLLKILEPLDLSINDVYITHLMKYRPYRVNDKGRIVSRSPQKSELEFFIPYLEKEISLVGPKIIITLGNGPLGWLSKDFSLKVDPKEDQLLVIGVLGKSYKLYPVLHPTNRSFGECIDRFNKSDQTRLRQVLYGEILSDDEPVKKPSISTIQEKVAYVSKLAKAKNGTIDKTVTDKKKTENNEVEEGSSNNSSSSTPDENDTYTKKRVYNKIQVSQQDSNKNYVTIVYGGEGFVDDPVLIAIERISSVLTELGVSIHRIDLYKGNIVMDKALYYINASKAVILAVNVEWLGIGYRMQHFLDDCFFRGDESFFRRKPLYGIAFTRHGFERDAYNHLRQSWEVLGGIEGVSLIGVVPSASELETNFDYLFGIDKKTEAFFRIIKQERGIIPTSSSIVKIAIETPVTNEDINLLSTINTKNPQSAEIQSGLIEDYDAFVEKQHKDIQEISSLFKKKLSSTIVNKDQSIPRILKDSYINKNEIKLNIQLLVDDQLKENTVIELNNQYIRSYFGQIADVDVTISGTKEIFKRILNGKVTMQRAFMTGEIKAKGDFTILYKFEQYFKF
jgi:uracil-DNA glycosylase family 4